MLRAAEPAREGEHLLLVRGRFGREHPAFALPLTIRLRVRPSSPEATRSLRALRRGDEVRVWCRAVLPRASGNPHTDDPLRGLRARGFDASGSVKNAWLIELVERGRAGPLRLLDGGRVALRARLERAFGRSPVERSVALAMLLGERASLDRATRRLFRDAGLAHLLAISGLHVALVSGLLIGLFRHCGLGTFATWAAGSITLAGLWFLVGGGAPVSRAAAGASLLLLGRMIGRDGDPLNALAVVAAALVADNPWIVWSPSFQLSFLACAGILLIAPPLARWLPGPRWLAAGIAVSAGAYLATAPAVAWHFGRLAPIALVSNLLAVPLCALVLAGSAAAAILGDLPTMGPALHAIATTVIGLLLGTCRVTTVAGPWAAIGVPTPPAWLIGAYAAVLVSVARARGSLDGAASALLRFTLLALALLLHLGPPPAGAGRVRLVLPDVGQGQSVLLRGPGGRFVVVDAAGTARDRFDASERVLVPLLRRLGCRRIDSLIVTHHHEDHAGGVPSLLRGFEVGEVWVGAGSLTRPAVRDLVDAARARGAAVVLAMRGLRRTVAGLPLHVLHPGRGMDDLGVNDRSVVVLAGRAPHRLLVPGDLESPGERALLAGGSDPRAEVLIVGHHGARAGTAERWLDAVSPTLALVSAGRRNHFGHPSAAVRARLLRRRIPLYRTDLHGMLAAEAAPRGWTLCVPRALRGRCRSRAPE